MCEICRLPMRHMIQNLEFACMGMCIWHAQHMVPFLAARSRSLLGVMRSENDTFATA